MPQSPSPLDYDPLLGEGISDSVSAFQKALARAKRTVEVPDGNFLAVNIITGVTKEILGHGGRIIKGGSGGQIMQLGSGARIAGLRLDGDADGTFSGVPKTAETPIRLLDDAEDVEIDDCELANFRGYAVKAIRPVGLRVRGSQFRGCDNPLYAFGGSTDLLIEDNEVLGTTNGTNAFSGADSTADHLRLCVRRNTIRSAARMGIEFKYAKDAEIVGNRVLTPGDMGISVPNAERTTVNGNTITGAGSYAIEGGGRDGCRYIGNVIRDHFGNHAGIFINPGAGTAHDTTLAANCYENVRPTGTYGLVLFRMAGKARNLIIDGERFIDSHGLEMFDQNIDDAVLRDLIFSVGISDLGDLLRLRGDRIVVEGLRAEVEAGLSGLALIRVVQDSNGLVLRDTKARINGSMAAAVSAAANKAATNVVLAGNDIQGSSVADWNFAAPSSIGHDHGDNVGVGVS